MNEENNISFLLEDNVDIDTNTDNDKTYNFEEMMSTFNDMPTHMNVTNSIDNLLYFKGKQFYGNDELFYKDFTVKNLMKICKYYGISKFINASKCKKQYVIDSIIFFENQIENYQIVQQRQKMWAFMTEILNDKHMKKYIIWN
jgi:hypothetical protein